MSRWNNLSLLVAVFLFILVLITGSTALAFLGRQTHTLSNHLELLTLHKEQLKTENNRLREELERLKRTITNEVEEEVRAAFPGGSGPIAYLTFDDGPSGNTLKILDILAEHGIPATFFVTGNNVSEDEDVYRRIIQEGHVLGNHTFSHNYQTIYSSVEDFLEDFLRLEEFIYQETGVRTNIMLFPGGSKSSSAQTVSGYNIVAGLIDEIKNLGYDYFDWNVSSGDGTAMLPREDIVANVLGKADQVTTTLLFSFTTVKARCLLWKL